MIDKMEGIDEFMQEIWLYSTPMLWIGGDNKSFVYCSAGEWLEGVHEFAL